MSRFYAIALLLLLATSALFAQSAGGAVATTGGTIMLNTAKGIFALRSGVLVKYDLSSMKITKELQIFGKPPTAPTDRTDNTAMQNYRTDLTKRSAAAIMIPKEDSLLVVVGDYYICVNQETLKAEYYKDMSTPVAATDTTTTGGGGAFRMPEGVPGYVLVGNTLILMRSKEVIAITTAGKILSRSPLPTELQPVQGNQMRGGGGNGGGGRRGGGGTGGGGGYGGGNPGGGAAGNPALNNVPPAE